LEGVAPQPRCVSRGLVTLASEDLSAARFVIGPRPKSLDLCL
jgi:hypothetical protein